MKRAVRMVLRSVGLRKRARSIGLRAKYFGLKYYCPLCGARLRSFAPKGETFSVLSEKSVIGGGYRPGGSCPVCRSSDRERLIYLYLKRHPGLLAPPRRILHVAPETNLGSLLRRRRDIDYIATDLVRPDVTLRADLTRIPFQGGSFDGIICSHVLEHIPDDAKAMAELFRVLRPGGWAILQVPISWDLRVTYENPAVGEPAEREEQFGQSDHLRIYGPDYPDRLRQAGFEVEQFRWTKCVEKFGGTGNRHSLLEGEIVFHTTKPGK